MSHNMGLLTLLKMFKNMATILIYLLLNSYNLTFLPIL